MEALGDARDEEAWVALVLLEVSYTEGGEERGVGERGWGEG